MTVLCLQKLRKLCPVFSRRYSEVPESLPLSMQTHGNTAQDLAMSPENVHLAEAPNVQGGSLIDFKLYDLEKPSLHSFLIKCMSLGCRHNKQVKFHNLMFKDSKMMLIMDFLGAFQFIIYQFEILTSFRRHVWRATLISTPSGCFSFWIDLFPVFK